MSIGLLKCNALNKEPQVSREERKIISHNYANVCIIMHAINPILFNSLPLMITKASVKFQPDRISSGRTDVRTDKEKYNKDFIENRRQYGT